MAIANPATDKCIQCGETFNIFNLLTVKCLHPYCAVCAGILVVHKQPCATCQAGPIELLNIHTGKRPDLYARHVETIQDIIGSRQTDLAAIARAKASIIEYLPHRSLVLRDIETEGMKIIQNIADFEKILIIVKGLGQVDFKTQIMYYEAIDSRIYELEEVRSNIDELFPLSN